jgi:hypothetical protein
VHTVVLKKKCTAHAMSTLRTCILSLKSFHKCNRFTNTPVSVGQFIYILHINGGFFIIFVLSLRLIWNKTNRSLPLRSCTISAEHLIEFRVYNTGDNTNENTPTHTHTHTLIYTFWHHIFNLQQKQRAFILPEFHYRYNMYIFSFYCFLFIFILILIAFIQMSR